MSPLILISVYVSVRRLRGWRGQGTGAAPEGAHAVRGGAAGGGRGLRDAAAAALCHAAVTREARDSLVTLVLPQLAAVARVAVVARHRLGHLVTISSRSAPAVTEPPLSLLTELCLPALSCWLQLHLVVSGIRLLPPTLNYFLKKQQNIVLF